MITVVARARLLAAPLIFASLCAEAKPWWMRGVDSNETDFLSPDVAFRAGVRLEGDALRLRWVIADGYYLYKQRISVAAESPDWTVGALQLPRGTLKTDAYLGTQEIYTQQVEATVPYKRFDYGAHPLQIKVTYQGCAEAGLCYPPITRVLSPAAASTVSAQRFRPWQGIAIGLGALAFFVAGSLLRKGRTLPLPSG